MKNRFIKGFFVFIFLIVFGLLVMEGFLLLSPGFGEDLSTSPTISPQGGITFEEDRQIAPPSPFPTVVYGEKVVNIQWQGTRLDTVTKYAIYRQCKNDRSWQPIGNISVEGDDTGIYFFTDENGNDCEYAVSTIDIYGNESLKEKAIKE